MKKKSFENYHYISRISSQVELMRCFLFSFQKAKKAERTKAKKIGLWINQTLMRHIQQVLCNKSLK